MCISFHRANPSNSPDRLVSRTSVDLLIAVAPSLKVLAFSQCCQGRRAIRYNYFSVLSQRIEFTQLRELHLHWIGIQYESLKLFLSTTKVTLGTLTLKSVTLSDNIPSSTNPNPIERNHDYCVGMGTIWQSIWGFLQDELSLQSFYMETLGYRVLKVLILGFGDFPEITDSANFDSKAGDISFGEWINRLTPVPSGERGDILIWKYNGETLT